MITNGFCTVSVVFNLVDISLCFVTFSLYALHLLWTFLINWWILFIKKLQLGVFIKCYTCNVSSHSLQVIMHCITALLKYLLICRRLGVCPALLCLS